MTNEKCYTMKVVAQRTGLSPHAIRVWEKRYSAVEPERTTTNRRLYSAADIERLTNLHRATQQGHSIGNIANLSDADLSALVAEPAFSPPPQEQPPLQTPPQESDPHDFVQRCLRAVSAMDGHALTRELMTAEVAMGRNRLLVDVIDPLMRSVGDMWSSGDLRVADEHLATSIVRTFLGTLHSSNRAPANAPLFISTTPAGQWHEIGALLASLTAQSAGWNTLYLGPNLPAEEIAAAAQTHGAKAVALSIIFPGDDALLRGELAKLRQALPDTPLLIGGRVAAHYQETIEELGAHRMENLALLAQMLQKIAAS